MELSSVTDIIVGYAIKLGLILIAMFIVMVLIKLAFNKSKTNKNNNEVKTDSNEIYPYKKENLLTKNEYIFWKELKKYADKNELLICPKVGLKDIFSITTKDNYMKYFGKIAQKHVDFVICDKALRLKFVIELDDKSHETSKRKESDIFKDKLFEINNIKLIRITAQKDYTEEQIKKLIEIDNFQHFES